MGRRQTWSPPNLMVGRTGCEHGQGAKEGDEWTAQQLSCVPRLGRRDGGTVSEQGRAPAAPEEGTADTGEEESLHKLPRGRRGRVDSVKPGRWKKGDDGRGVWPWVYYSGPVVTPVRQQ